MTFQRGLRIDGGDTLTYPSSGIIRAAEGTLTYKLNLRYASTWAERATIYVFNVTNLIRCYYNTSDDKFYFEVYNGVNWTTVQMVSAGQTFLFDAAVFIACRWHNANGSSLNVDGVNVADATTWTAQALPVTINIGSEESLNLDIRLFKKSLSDAEVKSIRLG